MALRKSVDDKLGTYLRAQIRTVNKRLERLAVSKSKQLEKATESIEARYAYKEAELNSELESLTDGLARIEEETP